jgi:hypothetical protein
MKIKEKNSVEKNEIKKDKDKDKQTNKQTNKQGKYFIKSRFKYLWSDSEMF